MSAQKIFDAMMAYAKVTMTLELEFPLVPIADQDQLNQLRKLFEDASIEVLITRDARREGRLTFAFTNPFFFELKLEWELEMTRQAQQAAENIMTQIRARYDLYGETVHTGSIYGDNIPRTWEALTSNPQVDQVRTFRLGDLTSPKGPVRYRLQLKV